MQKETILVLGAGSFGTCLAQHLTRKNIPVIIWDIDKDVCNDINLNNKNKKYFAKFSNEYHKQNTKAFGMVFPNGGGK